jgi:hypothetical protein
MTMMPGINTPGLERASYDCSLPILDFGECPPSAQNPQAASMHCLP